MPFSVSFSVCCDIWDECGEMTGFPSKWWQKKLSVSFVTGHFKSFYLLEFKLSLFVDFRLNSQLLNKDRNLCFESFRRNRIPCCIEDAEFLETWLKETPYFEVETAVEQRNQRITNALLQLCKQCRPAMKEKRLL